MDMQLKTVESGNENIITITGRVDSMSASTLQAEIEKIIENKEILTLDFSNVEYVSSAGLRVLLFSVKKSEELGVKLVLKNVKPDIKELFVMTGFIDILTLE